MSRGMKKFLPFASLKEQALFLAQMTEAKKRVEKPQISEDTAAEINRIFVEYAGEMLLIYYYAGGYIKQIKSVIKRLDVQNKTLQLEALSIKFSNILNVEIVD